MYRYDVAVSFAGEDREIVEHFVRILLDNRVSVFYDAIQEESLWGKDLYQYLATIYREAARYCVIFVSKHYAGKRWPEHELTSAQARAFQQNSEYILPVKLDDTELPGLPPTVGYLDAREKTISDICELLLSKLVRKLSRFLMSPITQTPRKWPS